MSEMLLPSMDNQFPIAVTPIFVIKVIFKIHLKNQYMSFQSQYVFRIIRFDDGKIYAMFRRK